MNRSPSDPQRTVLAVEQLVRLDLSVLQRRGHGHDLEGRAGLVLVDHRPVDSRLGPRLAESVGVGGRTVGQRQHLSGSRVQQHGRGGVGARLQHGAIQLALDDVLYAQVDGQHDIVRSSRGSSGDLAQPAVVTVAHDAVDDGIASQGLVELALDSFQSLAVDAGETDHVNAERSARVSAAGGGQETERVT